MRTTFILLSIILAPTYPAHAQDAVPIIISDAVENISVTLYRDKNRPSSTGLEADFLDGFALITETRIVNLPKGIVNIRFEGVASGIQPNSAIVTGPQISEKNRDRQILSQSGLINAFTGQRVIIRRNNPATGRSEEEAGTIRSGPGRLILQTQNGYEAIYCDGMAGALIYPGLPANLTAKPILSVLTNDQPGGLQEISLSYLAGNFDWQANYIAEMAPDGRSIDLLGWMTMASQDQTSFVNANVFAVAGVIERQNDDGEPGITDDVENDFHACWPMETTTSGPWGQLPPAAPAAPAPMMIGMEMQKFAVQNLRSQITVTAAKTARQEDLGDLKLYQIPFPVTIAAQSQKQVAFLQRKNVKGEIIYRSNIEEGKFTDPEILYRIQNRKSHSLGVALPAGKVTFFQSPAGQRHLIGESNLDDKAVDEEVDLPFADANNVAITIDKWSNSRSVDRYEMTVRNANPFAINFEAEFENNDEYHHFKFSKKTVRKNGKIIWRLNIPPNSAAKLGYNYGPVTTVK